MPLCLKSCISSLYKILPKGDSSLGSQIISLLPYLSRMCGGQGKEKVICISCIKYWHLFSLYFSFVSVNDCKQGFSWQCAANCSFFLPDIFSAHGRGSCIAGLVCGVHQSSGSVWGSREWKWPWHSAQHKGSVA